MSQYSPDQSFDQHSVSSSGHLRIIRDLHPLEKGREGREEDEKRGGGKIGVQDEVVRKMEEEEEEKKEEGDKEK